MRASQSIGVPPVPNLKYSVTPPTAGAFSSAVTLSSSPVVGVSTSFCKVLIAGLIVFVIKLSIIPVSCCKSLISDAIPGIADLIGARSFSTVVSLSS